MHEWALAEGVIATALEAVEREGLSRITRLSVHVGELQRISLDVFEHAIRTVLPHAEPRLQGADIQISIEPARLECRACGADFAVAEAAPADGLGEDQREAIHFVPELAHAFLRCPSCESPDFRVLRGRGVSIATLEAE